MILADLALSRRLERAEGSAGARFVEAHASIAPELGACWMEAGGAYAMYDGPGSPATQTFGLGLFETPTPSVLDRLEDFFRQRRAPVFHEVSPIAEKSLLTTLPERGYRPVELTSIMFLPLPCEMPDDCASPIRVRVAAESDLDVWAHTAAEGWRDMTDLGGLLLDTMRVTARKQDSPAFLAELDGQPIAAGGMFLHQGIALLAGASTIPAWRRRGAQRALLRARLEYAARAGCDLAMMGAEPGSGSQRNAQRQGFRIAYTRIKWGLGQL